MTEPKRADGDPAQTNPSAEPVRSKGGGFGAFSEAYRSRWEASHPNMVRRWAAHDVPAHDAPAQAPEAATPAAETGTTDRTDEGSSPPPVAPASG
jgi:hypothetical protein